MLKGVHSVLPGYSGGEIKNPSYEQVSVGNTGHAEVVKVDYDPEQVKFADLLTIFFASHDPTTQDRQGADVGPQYRSVIFYEDEEQRQVVKKFINDLNASSQMGAPIVTQIEPLKDFYEAEDYHKDYFAKNSQKSYCQVVINPKLQKVKERFANLLKK